MPSGIKRLDSIKVPGDLDLLRFLQQPKNRYEMSKYFKNLTYQAVLKKVNKLEKMGLIFVVRKEHGPGPGEVPYFLITVEGRSVLRGFEEAERRE